jgi:hypothetical protein
VPTTVIAAVVERFGLAAAVDDDLVAGARRARTRRRWTTVANWC